MVGRRSAPRGAALASGVNPARSGARVGPLSRRPSNIVQTMELIKNTTGVDLSNLVSKYTEGSDTSSTIVEVEQPKS